MFSKDKHCYLNTLKSLAVDILNIRSSLYVLNVNQLKAQLQGYYPEKGKYMFTNLFM